MPYTFYFLMLSHVQEEKIGNIIQIAEYEAQIKQIDVDIFQVYRKYHKALTDLSRKMQPYLIYLVISLSFAGSIDLFEDIVDSIRIVRCIVTHDTEHGPVLIAEIIVGIPQTIAKFTILYLWPLAVASRLSGKQKSIVSNLLMCSKEDRNERRRKDAHDIHMLQNLEGTGYQVFGCPLTKWKTVLFAVIGPLLKILVSQLQ